MRHTAAYTLFVLLVCCCVLSQATRTHRSSSSHRKSSNTHHSTTTTAAATRSLESLDFDWRFNFGDLPSDQASAVQYDDSTWRAVNVPHDFVVEGTFNSSCDASHGFLCGGVGWYRRNFTLSSAELASNALYTLVFDGVYRDSNVWLNGHVLGSHRSGYTSFRLTVPANLLAPGGVPNVLAVRADARNWEGWWYEGGGIYRHVWLESTNTVHVSPYGVFVRSAPSGPIAAGQADSTVTCDINLSNQGAAQVTVDVTSTVYDAQHVQQGQITTRAIVLTPTPVAPARDQDESATTQGVATPTLTHKMQLTNAKLWSPDTPYLYTVVTEVRASASKARDSTTTTTPGAAAVGQVYDQVTTSFGIRKLLFDTERGLFINDEPVKVKGMCNHQDFGGVGVAMPYAIHEFRLRMLKDMGANAVRASHNPQAPEFLDLCDKIGLLVWNENHYLYNDSISQSDLSSLVLRDRNHPSVFMWSLCNEALCETRKADIGAQLKQIVKTLDDTRPVTAALNYGWFDTDGLARVLDVVGFNYGFDNLQKMRDTYPSTPLTLSECTSAVSTRGQYQDNATAGYLSAYDVHQPGWGELAWQAWQEQRNRPWLEGGFVWTGFDYKGEPTPYQWPVVNSLFGSIDMVGFPKDTYFYYRTWWAADRPMLHVFPHWNWPAGASVNVWVYSAAYSVELFINDRSQGIQTMPRDYHVEWNVKYEAGTLRAVGYNEDGSVWAQEVVHTSGGAARVRLSFDRLSAQQMVADGQSTVLVTAEILDQNGVLVPTAADQVSFAVTGSGAVLGVGNGDNSSHEPDKASQRHAFAGRCRVLVQAALSAAQGNIVLRATAPGLTGDSITIPVTAAAHQHKHAPSMTHAVRD